MAAIYDALGNVIGDDGQPSIDQMQYELAKKGQALRPLDKVTEHFKNIVTQFNPIMMPKVMQDVGTMGLNIGSIVASPYADILHNIQATGAAGLHNLAGDEQSALEALARTRPVSTTSLLREPNLPVVREFEQGLGKAFEASKLPPLGPGSGMPGSAPVSPRPLFTPNDLRVVGAEATRVGRQVGEIPTDFANAQSGLQRIDPVTGQPVLGARIQSGVDRLGDIMEQRRMQGLTPIPGLPAALQPETNMYAVRKSGSKLTTPTLPETAKEYVPDVDPVGQMLREISIDPNVTKPTPTMLDEIVTDQIKKSDNSNTAMSAFRYFQEAKALELFPDAPSGSDALMALKVSLYDDNARNTKINELYDEFIQTPEGQEFLPNAASTSELAERHEAAVQGLKNMWGKYLVKNLGTEGNPAVKMAAQEGLTYLPADEVIDAARSQKSTARSFRRNAGTPIEGSFATGITALQQEIETLNLPIKNAANAEQSLLAQRNVAKTLAEQDPSMIANFKDLDALHKEAKKSANNLVKQKTEIQKKLDKLVLADAYETLEDASVAPIDASTMMEKLPYAVRQFYPDLKEAAKRGEMSYTAYPAPMKETGIIDAAKQFYDDVLANRIPKDKAPTYPVDRYIHGIAKERVQNIQKYRTDVFNDMKSVSSAIPENKQFNGNVGVIELTKDTPEFVANKEAALSTEALDICIGEGGGGSGTRNFFTKKKDPRWTPIVDILTGKPNPNASRYTTSYVQDIYNGGELPMFRDLETGMPIAALQFMKSSSTGANGQPKFNIGYASGAQNGFIEPKYIDGIRDYLNTRADDIAGIGENLEKNAGIYDTRNKTSLSKSRSSAQVSADQMKTVDWDSMPRFMTAKDIKQAVQGAVTQQSSFNPADVAELKATLVDNIEFVVNEAMRNSNVYNPDAIERRLETTFAEMQSRFFPTFFDSPVTSMNEALDFLRAQIRRNTSHGSEQALEIATALESYASELETARDDMISQQQRSQQPAPQAPAPQTAALTPVSMQQRLNNDWQTTVENALSTSNQRDRLSRTLERYFIELRNRHYLQDPTEFEMDPDMHLSNAINDLTQQVIEATNAGTDFSIEFANALDSYRDDLSGLRHRYRDQQLAVQMQQPEPQVAPMQQAEQLLQRIERPLRSTNDGIVNDALQEYARSLQRFASNQLENGLSPIEVAVSVRDAINTLRNVVLAQPTDPTRNFTPDQLGDYVSALRQTIDDIGQWLESQQQRPQAANLPAEVQQNIDNRNRQITSAYQRPLDPDSAFSNTNDALSEFIDLLDGMATNLYGNGLSFVEIAEHLQGRIRSEIMVLSDPNRVANRGLNGAEADVLRNRLNDAYGNLATVHDQLNAPAPQAPEQLQELPDDFFEPDATHPANQRYTMQSAIDMALELFEQERIDANNFDIRSIEDSIHALREGLFDDERIRRLSPRDQVSFSEDVAFRLQNMLDDIRGRRPDRNLVADPGDAREALDNAIANIDNDYGIEVANDASMVRQSISEHVNPGDELSEYVYQLRRNRPGMSEDLRQALDHMAEELESVANEAPRNAPTPVPAQPATAPYRPIPAIITAMSDQAITADMTPEERNRVQVMFETLTDVNMPGELQNIVSLARSHAMGFWENFSDVQREWLARNIEEYIQDNTSPPEEAPATELEQHWRNDVFNGDLNSRQVLTRLNNILSSTNLSVEDLEVLRSIVNDPDSPQFRVADDDTLRQYNDVIDQAISQREPPATDNVFGATGQTLRITDRDRELYTELNDMLDNAIEEGYPLPDLGDNEAVARLILNDEVGGDINNATDAERRRLASLVRRYGAHGTLPRGRKDGGRVRKYKKGGTVQPIPSVEQMKNELMMRRA